MELAAAPSLAQLPLRGVEMLMLLAFMHAEILTCLKRKPPTQSVTIICSGELFASLDLRRRL